MAVDVQGNSNDVFQTAYKIMEYIYSNFEYSISTTSVSTHATFINEHADVLDAVCHARALDTDANDCGKVRFKVHR